MSETNKSEKNRKQTKAEKEAFKEKLRSIGFTKVKGGARG